MTSDPREMQAYVRACFASEARRAIVLRRGPSHCVLLVAWDTATDTFEPGQWLKGRVDEGECSLSPDGRLFAYRAERRRGGGLECWSAISRPPYFTALALWHGLATVRFVSDQELLVDSDEGLAPGFALPDRFRTGDFGVYGSPPTPWRYEDDELVAPRPRSGSPFQLHLRHSTGAHFIVELSREHKRLRLESATWAEWDPHTGDLILAEGARLLRCDLQENASRKTWLAHARALVDLGELSFAEVPPPPEARVW